MLSLVLRGVFKVFSEICFVMLHSGSSGLAFFVLCILSRCRAQVHDCWGASVHGNTGYQCNNGYTCNLQAQLPVTGVDDCCTACKLQVGCAAFTYELSGSYCYLWNNDGALRSTYQSRTETTYILAQPVSLITTGTTDAGCGTCQSMGWQCGSVLDRCGNTLDCGTCGDGSACDYNSHLCDCGTCETWGWTCGEGRDACGNVLQCGNCADGSICDFNSHQCDCGTQCTEGSVCGQGFDACGNRISCGTCPDGHMCIQPAFSWGEQYCRDCGTCESLSLHCSGTDLCGRPIDCPNRCPGAHDNCCEGGCYSEPVADCTFYDHSGSYSSCYTCQALGAQCGIVDLSSSYETQGAWCAQDTLDCGSCAAGSTCNGNNQCSACGTCASLGLQCGAASDGCGGSVQCGECSAENICVANHCIEPGCTGVSARYSATEYAVVLPNLVDFSQVVQFTLAAWVYAPRFDSVERSVLSLPIGLHVTGSRITLQSAKTAEFLNGSTTVAFSGNPKWFTTLVARVQVKRWTHVAAVFNGTHQRLFVDGLLTASAPCNVNNTYNYNPIGLMFGREFQDDYNGRHTLNSSIAETALWNRALSPSEIQTIYAGHVTSVDRRGRVLLAYCLDEQLGQLIRQDGTTISGPTKASANHWTAPAIEARCGADPYH
eukprot:TRINITY_DN11616_c0_g1_i1.p1 TRINITY_DN11616_c0_g1~~TRINITY_DN11616_c0_g1_i1.p1  ORF type:complete len:666 (-),score=132.93 TRINITY_DN11616_c0_g1_i1:117-2087(-)